jgi:hypothetical protein
VFHAVGVTSPLTTAKPKDDEPPGEAKNGLSQFAMRILDQLSLTSWLPATFLVGTSLFLFKLASMKPIDISRALEDLSNQNFGVLVVVFLGVVTSAMVIQAFEFSAIRTLEGYWPYFFSRVGITRWRVGVMGRKRKRALKKSRERLEAAFQEAQERLLAMEGVEWAVVRQLRELVLNPSPRMSADGEVVRAARQLEWQAFSAPRLLRAMEAAQRARDGWPAAHRVMPTRLGNTLRSSEDRLNVGSEGLRTYVIRHWHLLSSEQKRLHSRYRDRLDLYCEMVLVCSSLAVLSAAVFATGHRHWEPLFVAVALLGMLALVCYRAAIHAATAYGEMLKLVEQLRTTADSADG